MLQWSMVEIREAYGGSENKATTSIVKPLAAAAQQRGTECQNQYGARDDIDFPPMMIYSLPTPFYVDRPIDHEAMKAALDAGLRRLEGTGVDFIAMPCNTAHIYYQELAARTDVPLLNMIDELVHAIPESAHTIALLATRPTVEAGIYQAAIERAGFTLLIEERRQTQIDRLIQAIKSSPDHEAARALWHDLICELETAGVDTVLLACTDLNVASTTAPTELTILDATRCLAQAVVRRWRAASR
jgi:aspartate racemase